MQTTIRTTVRIRKDLFDQFRFLALKKGSSLQEVINNTLALGLGKVSDLDQNRKAMSKIDKFRISLADKKIFSEDLLDISKFDLK